MIDLRRQGEDFSREGMGTSAAEADLLRYLLEPLEFHPTAR